MLHRADTVIIGAGQAGLALSHRLTVEGHDHVLLERGRIGERWRSERWDSLALLTPNWANRLPGMPPAADPDAYLSGREFVEALERYARSFGAPVHGETTVLSVSRTSPGDGYGRDFATFEVRTDRGDWLADNVVLASGDCAVPLVPWFASSAPAHLDQLHASRYRSPDALRPGGVLVVGSGPSGHQIAHELAAAGRRVVLPVGRHSRIPRRYRGRDIWTWMRDLGDLTKTLDDLPYDPRTRKTPTLPLDGRDGGRTVDLAVLADAGVQITGRLEGFAGSHALLAGDLHANVDKAEERLQRLLDRIDERAGAITRAPDAPAPLRLPDPPASLDLDGIGTIVWATGYKPHYPWLRVPGALGPDGAIVHDRGETPVPGLFVLGTRWQFRTTSHQIGGVGDDAHHLAERIVATTAAPLAAVA